MSIAEPHGLVGETPAQTTHASYDALHVGVLGLLQELTDRIERAVDRGRRHPSLCAASSAIATCSTSRRQ